MKNIFVWFVTSISCFTVYFLLQVFDKFSEDFIWLSSFGWIISGICSIIITIKIIIEKHKEKTDGIF